MGDARLFAATEQSGTSGNRTFVRLHAPTSLISSLIVIARDLGFQKEGRNR